ncbi:MAG: isoleucine--tRNA ligase [Alphaproteobacteria bacterium]|nr:isoleucine--tRNA ligase [Alphaproteobacteria bacterium]
MTDLKNTIFLPKTDFAMKAGLSKKEPVFLKHWEEIDLYQRIRSKSQGKKKFILHYGPPYANGHIHIGHALTSILKDIIVKSKQMSGYDAPMVPGWDCHGLPIEWKVEESYTKRGIKKQDIAPLDMIKSCREFATKWIDVQKEEFKRLGIIADWQNPYITMDYKIEAGIIKEISKFLMNGSLYRGLKTVPWSVIEQTALAEAEIEYHDHISDSVYVGFPVVNTDQPYLNDCTIMIWTTTPWTLPANRAIAYGDDITYVIVNHNNKKYVVAKDLLHDIGQKLGLEHPQIIHTFQGSSFKNTLCAHPLRGQGYDFDVPLLSGAHVTTEAGTGLVHTAPSHGEEDFVLAQQYNLPIPELVGGDGYYTEDVPLFAGVHVYKANPLVIEALTQVGALVYHTKLKHSYPHSWRSKTPLIYRATAQWFVSMEHNHLRDCALSEIDRVEWHPERNKNRIRAMVENRPDWCLSRQRMWGTPLSIFVHKKTGELLRDQAVQDRIIHFVEQEGVEAWISRPASDFLGDKYDANMYEKVTDIVDVWFDSGSTHAYVLQERPELAWPADLYLEGSDQHRGWFQSSLLESCATMGQAPYDAVLTHGFTLDEKGYKMSKSLGNVVVPQQVIDRLGADVLRLWVINSDYTEDQRIGDEILKQQEDIYRRFRNTLRYLLGAIQGYSDAEKIEHKDMPPLEQWVLHRLAELNALHQKSLENFDLGTFYSALHVFCSQDLSAFYFDIRKDVLYCDHETDPKRKATRTVMDVVVNALMRWLAPVLSFTAEEAWWCYIQNQDTSIHEQDFLDIPQDWLNEQLGQEWKKIRHYRKAITGALEVERNAKTIGSSLQAHVVIYATPEIADLLHNLDLSELSIASQASLVIATPPAEALTVNNIEGIGVVVDQAKGSKCERCWKITPEVGQHQREMSHICHRCERVVKVHA